MKMVLCVKMVRAGLMAQSRPGDETYVMNPYDLLALTRMVDFKKTEEDKVVCMSMGGEQIGEALVKCYAMGADEVYWMKDEAFAGSDTVATSYILSHAIRRLEGYDLVVCGAKSMDGETGQVGAGIAERLGIPLLTGAEELLASDVSSVTVRVSDETSGRIVKIGLPALIAFRDFTMTADISLFGLKKARRKEIRILDAKALMLETARCGFKGSKTAVVSIRSNMEKKEARTVDGDVRKKVQVLKDMMDFRR
ncbi:MAG: hypothetical protein LBQ15_12705 [Clostridium sp.]|jgi:electron transfer flavoprotein beta subunit|nr:hypothetical protein [Clostridium sp.]